MKNYLFRENIKFVIESIIAVLIMLAICAIISKIEQVSTDAAYKEGYEQALEDYGIDE